MVVIVAPADQPPLGVGQVVKDLLVQQFIAEAPVKLSIKAFCWGLSGAM